MMIKMSRVSTFWYYFTAFFYQLVIVSSFNKRKRLLSSVSSKVMSKKHYFSVWFCRKNRLRWKSSYLTSTQFCTFISSFNCCRSSMSNIFLIKLFDMFIDWYICEMTWCENGLISKFLFNYKLTYSCPSLKSQTKRNRKVRGLLI